MAKIDLELGGRYTAGEMFSRAQTDMKQFGRSTNDITSAGRSAFNELAKNIDGGLAKSVTTASSLLRGLATGGIWGILGAAATSAISLISEHFEQAKKKATELAQALSNEVVNAMKGLQSQSSSLKQQIEDANKSVQSMVATANGEISSDVRNEVANLNVQALQKITDSMTEASKKVLQAQTDYETAIVKAQGEIDKCASQYNALNERERELQSSVEKQKELVDQANAQKEQFEQKNSELFYQYATLQAQANETVQQLIDDGVSISTAEKTHAGYLEQLAKFEEENKKVLEQRKEIETNLVSVQKNLTDAEQMLNDVHMKAQTAGENEIIATKEMEATRLQYKVKIDEAKAAQEKDTKATEELARKKKQQLESAELERANEVIHAEWMEYISLQLKEQSVSEDEYNRLVQRLNRALEDGCEDAEIESGLREEWMGIMEDRNALVQKANEIQEKENKSSSANGSKSNGGNAVASASASFSIDYDKMATAIDNVIGNKDRQGFAQWWQNVKNERNQEKTQMNQKLASDQTMWKAWYEGRLTGQKKQDFINYVKQTYTPDMISSMKNDMLKTTLMSKSEQQKMKSTMEDIENIIKKLGNK